jgi:hypothetical protein
MNPTSVLCSAGSSPGGFLDHGARTRDDDDSSPTVSPASSPP